MIKKDSCKKVKVILILYRKEDFWSFLTLNCLIRLCNKVYNRYFLVTLLVSKLKIEHLFRSSRFMSRLVFPLVNSYIIYPESLWKKIYSDYERAWPL